MWKGLKVQFVGENKRFGAQQSVQMEKIVNNVWSSIQRAPQVEQRSLTWDPFTPRLAAFDPLVEEMIPIKAVYTTEHPLVWTGFTTIPWCEQAFTFDVNMPWQQPLGVNMPWQHPLVWTDLHTWCEQAFTLDVNMPWQQPLGVNRPSHLMWTGLHTWCEQTFTLDVNRHSHFMWTCLHTWCEQTCTLDVNRRSQQPLDVPLGVLGWWMYLWLFRVSNEFCVLFRGYSNDPGLPDPMLQGLPDPMNR